jgi:hypothetical protein
MKLPVDTSAIAFLCALEPQPVLDFETRRPRADENGEPLYVVQLIALAEGEAEILAVKVPGLPSQAIRQGHPVKVHGLVAQPWTMNDRAGVAFRAARPDRAGRPGRQGQLAERRRCPTGDREGGDRSRRQRAPVPSTHQTGCVSTRPSHQEIGAP